MNISYNWLKEYINLPLTPQQTADTLTQLGLETGGVEEVESIKGGLRGLVIGHVLTCTEHPDSDHLHITTVDLGLPEPVQIVCGAPNVAAGQYVVVATVGTTLYDGDKEFKIKKSKIRGVESLGMICAEDEIGVGTSHDGIIVIPEEDAPAPGTPAAEFFGLSSDWVLEVDLTPNRIDAASHYGVARDLNAWLGLYSAVPGDLHRPSVDDFMIENPVGGIDVDVVDTDACKRYCGITVKGVKVEESPEWLRTRLATIGLRPINNIVDITNYMLHSYGLPLHCFDVAKIEGNRVVVRKADEGHPFTTLDGVERKLSANDLMICNASEPMCIAGVFGGLDSGVTETTTDIFLEAACFDPTSVRKTARRHGLSTDASFRFERGADPNACMYVLKLAALLVKELAGGTITGPLVDIYPNPVGFFPVDFSYDALNELVGRDIPRATVDKILSLLEITFSATSPGKQMLRVPTYRYDVRRQCDVAEEILRVYGYNNIDPGHETHGCLTVPSFNDIEHDMRNRIADQLTACGFNEMVNNSLTARDYYAENAAYPIDHCVNLLNPLSNDLGVMRQTLLYGGLEACERNINRRRLDLRLYEFGNVYFANPAKESTPEHPLAPYSEEQHLGLWISGNLNKANWARQAQPATFFDLKAICANIFARLGIPAGQVVAKPAEQPLQPFEVQLDIETRNGKHLGHIAMVGGKTLARFDIKQPVVYAEFNWNALVEMAVKHNALYAPLPKTHPVKRDLALLIDNGTSFAEVKETVTRAAGKLLQTVELFDVYEGKNLPAGKKSYAISLTLQDPEKTLQDRAIDAVMKKVMDAVQTRLHAEIR